MQKSGAQRQPDRQETSQKPGAGASAASPQGRQIAQLENMAQSSPQVVKQARLAAMTTYAPAHAAQRKMAGAIAESPRQTAQLHEIANAFGVIQAKTDVKQDLGDRTSTKTSNKKIKTPNFGEAWFRFAKSDDVIDTFSANITDQSPAGTVNPVSGAEVDIAAKAKEMDDVEPGDIAGKTRAKHFKWGDAQKGISAGDRTGKWTWHHKKDAYKMELVDMHAHGGFFHYGGFSGWRDNEDDDAGTN